MIDLVNCSDYTLLSTSEVSQALNISEGAVRKAAKDGRLRVIGGFRVLYFSARSVREFTRGEQAGSTNGVKNTDEGGPRGEVRACHAEAEAFSKSEVVR
jgi:hypothetical protein